MFLEGRGDDTIIRGAENIAPAKIEDVLMRHPDVLDLAVVGVPDSVWGQQVVAAVVVREGSRLTEDELRAFARSASRTSKTPEQIHFWHEIPRTDAGKIVRRAVASRLGPDGIADRTRT